MNKNVKILVILLLLFCFAGISTAETQSSALHDFSDVEDFNEAINLDKVWEVYPGKILEPKDFGAQAKLNPVLMPFDDIVKLRGAEIQGYDFGTIRTKIRVDEKNKDTVFATYGNLFLGEHSIYINNEKMLNDKKLVQHDRNNELLAPSLISFKTNEGFVDIVINFVGTDTFSLNRKQIQFGKFEEMKRTMHKQIGLDMFILGIFLAISMYHGTFYLRRNNRKSKSAVMFYYIIMAFVVMLRIASFKDSYVLSLYSGIDYAFYGKINYFSMFALTPSILLYYFEHFYENVDKKIKSFSQIVLSVYILSLFIFDFKIYSKLLYVHIIYVLSIAVIVIKWIIEKDNKKHKEFYLMIFGMLILSAISFTDIINKFSNIKVNGSYFILVLLLFILNILIMGYRYSNAFNEAEDFRTDNKELESKINLLEQEIIDTVERETMEIENKYIFEKNENESLKSIISSSEDLYVVFDENQKIIDVIGNLEKEVTNFKNNNHKFSDVLFKDDIKMRDLSNDIFEKIYVTEEGKRIDIYLTLMPHYVKYSNRTLRVRITKARNEKSEDMMFVALIKDVSEIKHMKERMHIMEVQNKMIKTQTKYKLPLAYLLYNACNFFEEEVFAMINKRSGAKQKFETIQDKLNNFYKWFGVFNFENTRKSIKKLNLKLIEMNNSFDEISEKEMKTVLKEGNIVSSINEDKLIIMNYINDGFEFDEEEMNKKIKVKKTVEVYEDVVSFISKDIDKGVNKLKIKSDDIDIKLMDYLMLLDKLYVLFEMMCVYDLEYEDVRKQRKKSNKGNIGLEIKDFGNKFKIIIESDGSGININNLKDSIFNKGLMTLEEINTKNEEELFQYILHKNIVYWDEREALNKESINTKDLLRSLNALGGEIHVESGYMKYLRFVIDVPFVK